MSDKFLTPVELVSRWGGVITATTLKMWRYRKKGPPYIKLGARILYRQSDIVSWESANSFQPSARAELGAPK